MKNKVEPGTVQSRSGITLIVGGFLLAGILGYLDAREIDVPLATRFISMLMILGGAFLCWRGPQYRAQATAQSIIGDSKPDVLYLSLDPGPIERKRLWKMAPIIWNPMNEAALKICPGSDAVADLTVCNS
ncbi:MAG TPA: hypothetical protein VGA01_17130 [Candidatus Binatia bacterium]